jgi:hypothetical protein
VNSQECETITDRREKSEYTARVAMMLVPLAGCGGINSPSADIADRKLMEFSIRRFNLAGLEKVAHS